MKTRKIALITGGSRGLGKNAAIRLAEKGFDIILTYSTNSDAAQDVVIEIEGKGGKAVAMQLNVEDVKSFDPFFQNVKNELQRTFQTDKFDALVNNAGYGIFSPIAEITEGQFDGLVNVHLKGTLFLTQKALPFLNDSASIVNISTALTRFSHHGAGTYASMKAAVETLSKYMALEFGQRNINVNTIAPGGIPTDFAGGALRNNEAAQKYMKSQTAISRLGHPDDIGGVVAFLCTEEAKWINAQRIEVSGGMSL